MASFSDETVGFGCRLGSNMFPSLKTRRQTLLHRPPGGLDIWANCIVGRCDAQSLGNGVPTPRQSSNGAPGSRAMRMRAGRDQPAVSLAVNSKRAEALGAALTDTARVPALRLRKDLPGSSSSSPEDLEEVPHLLVHAGVPGVSDHHQIPASCGGNVQSSKIQFQELPLCCKGTTHQAVLSLDPGHGEDSEGLRQVCAQGSWTSQEVLAI